LYLFDPTHTGGVVVARDVVVVGARVVGAGVMGENVVDAVVVQVVDSVEFVNAEVLCSAKITLVS
jgi:hypothetical protein